MLKYLAYWETGAYGHSALPSFDFSEHGSGAHTVGLSNFEERQIDLGFDLRFRILSASTRGRMAGWYPPLRFLGGG
jgi:hypothetical protein